MFSDEHISVKVDSSVRNIAYCHNNKVFWFLYLTFFMSHSKMISVYSVMRRLLLDWSGNCQNKYTNINLWNLKNYNKNIFKVLNNNPINNANSPLLVGMPLYRTQPRHLEAAAVPLRWGCTFRRSGDHFTTIVQALNKVGNTGTINRKQTS